MKIGNFDLDKEVLVVAEIGNNHEGSYTLAEEMIGLAAKAGAGAVKFQTIVPDKLVSVTQKERLKQLEKFRLNYDEFEKLSMVAKKEGIMFLSTPFDIESAQFLNNLVPAFKISSGDNNFFSMIDEIARAGKPIILSAGLTNLEQIHKTKNFIEDIWHDNQIDQEIAILHCVVSYPTTTKDTNLLFIRELQRLNVTVGYSDHTVGIEASVLAVALGARIIEKHFSIRNSYSDFRDQRMSANPEKFALLAEKIRETVEMLGDGKKRILECEKKIINEVRRSIIATHNLDKGAAINLEDLGWVRPRGGIAPGQEDKLINKKLARSIKKGEMILLEDVTEDSKKRGQ